MKTYCKCPNCGFENLEDSLFCTECGKRLFKDQKSKEKNRLKCSNCGNFNDLDAKFCIFCGKELIKTSKENLKRPSEGLSYKTISLIIILIFVFGFLIKLGITFFSGNKSHRFISKPVANVDETQVIAVAKHFKCACGGCGELPLATCECDMPKGAVEMKTFIRERLSEGFSVNQVIELLDRRYGHRI